MHCIFSRKLKIGYCSLGVWGLSNVTLEDQGCSLFGFTYYFTINIFLALKLFSQPPTLRTVSLNTVKVLPQSILFWRRNQRSNYLAKYHLFRLNNVVISVDMKYALRLFFPSTAFKKSLKSYKGKRSNHFTKGYH